MTNKIDDLDEDTQTINAPKRDFLYLSAAAMGAIGVASALWPFIDSMNPAADTLALSSVEVDIAPIKVGQAVTIMWRGKPVFIRHRSADEITKANDTEIADLRDPVEDKDRTQKPEWLIMVGICTHLGCVPLGQKTGEAKGDFGGWFCPCHGSHYDTSGRIRKGPAPKNLVVPDYAFISDTKIKIG